MECKNCTHKQSTEYIKGLLKLPTTKILGKDYISVEDIGKVADKTIGKSKKEKD